MSALNISSFIWGIADDVLRDVYVRGKYRDVILPMTVIRRLDAVLEPTKDAVLRMKEQLDRAGVTNQDAALRQASGEAFYNTSQFRLRDLTSRGKQQQLRADFEAYLDGFSPNVQEVLEKFKFHNQIPTLVEADALGFLLEKFLDRSINLSPRPVLNGDGSVPLGGPGQPRHGHGLRGAHPALQRGEQRGGRGALHPARRGATHGPSHLPAESLMGSGPAPTWSTTAPAAPAGC